jgi:murein DD-endopeptidase MepM/ murein hydrolase activator NlpD
VSSQRDLTADDLATPDVTATSLTRRQIREQERAAEAAARAAEYAASLAQAEAVEPTEEPVEDAAVSEEADADEPVVVSDVEDPDSDDSGTDASKAASAVADLSDSETAPTHTPARSRFRPGGRRPAGVDRPAGRKPTSEQPRVHRWVPRLAVLAALGVATTVVPLTGAALPESPSVEVTTQSLAATSALDILAGGAYVPADGTQALAADPEARARALAAASRDNGSRDELTCGTASLEANGVVAAETTMTPVDLVMPITAGSYSITSRYGYRSHPIYGSYSEHTGLDMAAAAGTPIHSIADGEVIYAGGGKDGRSGMLVIVQHEIDGEPVWSWYVHMYPNGVFVDAGDVVTAGEVIGAVGSYGNSTGPHLHLEIHLDEALTTVDPQSWLATHDAAPLTGDTPLCSEG